MTITRHRARLNACARRKVRKCRIKVVVLCYIRRLTCGDSAVDVHSHSHWESWLRHSHSRRRQLTANTLLLQKLSGEWGLISWLSVRGQRWRERASPPTTSRVLCVRGGKSWRRWGRPVAVSCQTTIQLLFIGIIKVTTRTATSL